MPKKRKGGVRQVDDAAVIKQLEERVLNEAPALGTNPLADRSSKATPLTKRFDGLPVSFRTLQGLKKANFENMKDIQSACIPHLLAGRDLMGAAKTGSGKTLAFLVPALEKLYRLGWNSLDGLGALVIAPTRELAIQIFEVLKKIGSFHEMSAGLVIGGKDVAQEQERVARMNVLVCTPGRLLQHMDETYGFECSGLQVLVLDEADRILDLGFSATINSILKNLPTRRQTVLFSATMSKSVKDLARLSLQSPQYIALHEAATYQTPTRLQQHYMEAKAEDKLDVLWSFIKTHLKAKTLVFLSSCNQVKFVYEALCRLRPGIVIAALHGKVKQEKRLQIFQDFTSRKEAVLLATDVAARGLDFPEVDWVLQLDCPEDVEAYIHRAGRTARNESKGKSLLLLTPSEAACMPDMLKAARVPIKKIMMNTARHQPLQQKLAQLVAQDPALKHMAQKAFVSYLRSVHLQSNKEVFDISKYSPEALAGAWGMVTMPRLRFVEAPDQKAKNIPYALREEGGGKGDKAAAVWRQLAEGCVEEADSQGGSGSAKMQNASRGADEENAGAGSEKARASAQEEGEAQGSQRRAIATAMPQSKLTKLFNRKNNDVLSSTYRRMVEDEQAGSSDDEIFTVSSKPRHMPSEAGWSDSAAHAEAAPDQAADVGRQGEVETKRVSKRSMKKIKVNGGNGTRVVFDEETGEALNPLVQLMRSGLGSKYVEGDRDTVTPEQHAAAIKQRIAASDMDDKAAFRQRQKDNKLALKIKLKKMLSRTDEEDQDGPAQLGGAASSEAETSEDDGSNDDDAQGAASDEASGAWNLGASSKDAKRKGEQIAAGSALKKKRKAGSGNGDGYDLAAQEDMALQMILSRRKEARA